MRDGESLTILNHKFIITSIIMAKVRLARFPVTWRDVPESKSQDESEPESLLIVFA